MESRRYLVVCKRWWWLVLFTVLVTVVATAWFMRPQLPTYESAATFVVKIQAGRAGDQAKAIDALVKGGTIGETYASIARSSDIQTRAQRLLTPRQRRAHASVSAETLTGTRLIRLSVTARRPDDARAIARAISAETLAYVGHLDDNYRLEPLDPPSLPTTPLSTHRYVTLTLGALLGLALGVGMAQLADRLKETLVPADPTVRGATPPSSIGDVLWTPRDGVASVPAD
jgi:capsular polysaccharide biosynthesis protein